MLYACGVGNVQKPKSIQAKTLFARCQSVVDDFTADDFTLCTDLATRRNEELHTGEAPFEDYPTGRWLARYYKVASKLLLYQGKDLEDVLDANEATAARTMIQEARADLEKTVRRLIAAHQTIFRELDQAAKDERESQRRVERLSSAGAQEADCPSCGNQGQVSGEVVRSTEPRLQGDEVYWEDIILPTSFQCAICGLRLRSHEQLNLVELGGQYTTLTYTDAQAYYLDGLETSRYFEQEYNNS